MDKNQIDEVKSIIKIAKDLVKRVGKIATYDSTNAILTETQEQFNIGINLLKQIEKQSQQLYDGSESIETVAYDCLNIIDKFPGTPNFNEKLINLMINQSGFNREAVITEMACIEREILAKNSKN